MPSLTRDECFQIYADMLPERQVDLAFAMWESDGRVYHDLHHLRSITTDVSQMALLFDLGTEAATELLLSALYHDVIYIPGEPDNEHASAQFVLGEVSAIPFWRRRRIYENIMITKDHRNPETFIQACLIDADLAGLGRDYAENNARVKAEYPSATPAQWRAGRLAFLADRLARSHTYFTVWGAQFEDSARVSMQEEYDVLWASDPKEN